MIKYGTIVGLQNIFFDKKIYDQCRYNKSNKYSMDYEIYFDIVNKFTSFLYVEYPATINIFHNNISNQFVKEQMKEAYSIAFKNSNLFERIILIKKLTLLFISKMLQTFKF